MYPSWAGWNFIPNSTAAGSLTDGTAGVAVSGQIVLLSTAASVVNDQVSGAMTFPARSLAPLAVTVYVVDAASDSVGSAPSSAPPGDNSASNPAGSYSSAAFTTRPVGSLMTNVRVGSWIASLKSISTTALGATAVAP